MTLSKHQKLRLQQLAIPVWELRSSPEAMVETPPKVMVDRLQPLEVINSSGENPVVFFWSDNSADTSEIFFKDVLIGINQQNSGWQNYRGDKTLFEEFLSTIGVQFVAIFISSQYQSVEFNHSNSNINIYLPSSPINLVEIKKQLWSAIYQTCYQ